LGVNEEAEAMAEADTAAPLRPEWQVRQQEQEAKAKQPAIKTTQALKI
jgi:hypothetical protein